MSVHASLTIRRNDFCLNANFSIADTGTTGIFGPSGSGKTTLLRAIAGLDVGAPGRLSIGNEIWQDESLCFLPHQRSVGFVFQESRLFSHLSVRGNLAYAKKRSANRSKRIEPENVIHWLGLSQLLDRNVSDLSGGERQRVAIARALLSQPKILLLDEPLASLDDNARSQTLELLKFLQRKLTIPVLFVSHSIDEIAILSDHLLVLNSGNIVAQGKTERLFGCFEGPLKTLGISESLLIGKVQSNDAHYCLSHISVDDSLFSVPGGALKVGEKARLRIRAKDISLSLERPQSTSALNVFELPIESYKRNSGPYVWLRLKLGSHFLLCQISQKSFDRLSLKENLRVFAAIKASGICL